MTGFKILQEAHGDFAAVTRTNANQGIGFPRYRVRGDQYPGLPIGWLEERARLNVMGDLFKRGRCSWRLEW